MTQRSELTASPSWRHDGSALDSLLERQSLWVKEMPMAWSHVPLAWH